MNPVSTPPQPPIQAKVKGVAFRSVVAALRELRGDELVEQMLSAAPQRQADLLRYSLVQTGWYPIEDYRALWQLILQHAGEDYALVRAIGAAAIRRDVTGVYRLLFKVLSEETVIRLSSKLFSTYYDVGSLTPSDIRRGHARASYRGCAGWDKAMWEEVAGAGEELIRLAGGREPRAEIVRGGGDHTYCEIVTTWR